MIVSCSNPEVVTIKVLKNDFVERDGLYYEPFSSSPANGIYEKYYPSGQLYSINTYKDGKLNGPFEGYDENGQLKARGTYKDGEPNGLVETYNKDGTLESKCFWVNFTMSYCE